MEAVSVRILLWFTGYKVTIHALISLKRFAENIYMLLIIRISCLLKSVRMKSVGVLLGCYCCDRKARAECAQSFTLCQQAPIEIMRRNHSSRALVIMFNRS